MTIGRGQSDNVGCFVINGNRIRVEWQRKIKKNVEKTLSMGQPSGIWESNFKYKANAD